MFDSDHDTRSRHDNVLFVITFFARCVSEVRAERVGVVIQIAIRVPTLLAKCRNSRNRLRRQRFSYR